MIFLLKIGQSKYIKDMYDNEYLFFNTVASFRKKEKDISGRNDIREANTRIRQLTSLKIITPKGKTINLSENSEKFNAQYNEFPKTVPNNICSFYTLKFDENLKYRKIDERVLRLGNKTLIIYNLEQFIEILDISLEEQRFEFSRKLVEYYNHRAFSGNLTFHHKDDLYNYQNEYRILLKTLGTNTINLKLPGLQKISKVVNSDELNTIEVNIT